MTSRTEIANLALAELGFPAVLDVDVDATKAARIMKLIFNSTSDALLRSHPWNFAMKRQTLALDAAAPAHGYTKQYALPSDFRRLVRVNVDDYRVEGKRLLTDQGGSIELLYIRSVADPNDFDAMYIRALATKMAQLAAFALTGRVDETVRMGNAHELAMQDARTVDGQENPAETLIQDEFETARYRGNAVFRPIAGI